MILNGILILKDFHHKYTRVFVSFLIRQEICICFLIFSRTLPVDDARWINFWQNSVFYLHYAFKWEKWLFIFRLGLIRVRTSHRTDTQVQTWWCQVPLFGWTKLLQPRFVANKRKHEFEHGKLWKILIKIMCHYWLKKHCKRLEHTENIDCISQNLSHHTSFNNKFYDVGSINGKLILDVQHVLSNIGNFEQGLLCTFPKLPSFITKKKNL